MFDYEGVEEIRHGLFVDAHNRVVRPVKKDIRQPFSWGNINWKNLVGWDWITFFIIASLLFSAWAFHNDTQTCYQLLEKPCTYCFEKGCPGCVKPLVSDEFRTDPEYDRSEWAEFGFQNQDNYTA